MSFRVNPVCLSLLLLVAGCAAAPESEVATDDSVGEADEAIVNGEEEDGHPQVMALMIPNLDGTETSCSGTLYAKRTLVTAAHCVQNAAIVFAYHGNDFWGDFPQLFGDPADYTNWALSTDFETHPKWNPETLNADIAIIHLDRDMPFKPMPVAFWDIPRREIGDFVKIVGYGGTGTDETGQHPIDHRVKRSGFSIYRGSPKAFPLPPNPHPGLGDRKIRDQLMKLDGRAPLSNMCLGDSGSPALMRFLGHNFMVGVASWTGDFCQDFSYYVRVHDFLPFLIHGAKTAPQ